jgi:hypothetical protein
MKYTGHTQNNGAVSNAIKKIISHPTLAQRNCQQRELSKFLKCYNSSLLMLTAGPPDQFSR